MDAFESATGVVTAFDEPRGLGMITSVDGVELPFHCTAIVDGTRTISVGERVRFTVAAGRAGRWEAARIETG
ncbi:MAG TPA: cold shock domain-containing protein [Acidimicrobiales bacterium]|jgi:cold shock CspA family protein